jgi:glycosyltransferase involved in cell wall biosynthesis
MHILFLSHYFYPEGNAPASRTYENCKRWVKSGHRVTVVTGAPNVPDGIIYSGYSNRLRQRESIDGIDVLRVWTYIAPNRGFLRRTLNYVSFMLSSLQGIFVRDVDLVVATSPQLFCALGGYLLSVFKRVPFVMEVRDLWPESIKTIGAIRSPGIIRCFEMVEMFLYRQARHIIVVSDSFRKVISGRGIDKEKISVIKNGVDLEFFSTNGKREETRESLGVKDKFIVSYIGTVGMAHALDCLLLVAEKMKVRDDIRFLIVGSGAEKENLLNMKTGRNLDNVIFVDRQPKETIPAFYECSDVCLVPLRKAELFKTVIPSKMFEIMSMGKPIIQSVDGEAREILEESRAGIYVEPENKKAIHDAIFHLYGNYNEARAFGQNGRRFVREKFNRDSLAGQYLDTLRNIVN